MLFLSINAEHRPTPVESIKYASHILSRLRIMSSLTLTLLLGKLLDSNVMNAQITSNAIGSPAFYILA